jgi:hypothetical protein
LSRQRYEEQRFYGNIGACFLECFYSAVLIRLFHSPIVLESYLNLALAACALALVLIAVTRGRLGYQEEAGAVFQRNVAIR